MSGLTITSADAGTWASGRRLRTSRSIRQTRSNRRRGVCRDPGFSLPQVCSLAPGVGSSISISCDERVGAMKGISQLVEVIAVLIPNFQTWGLSASVSFSLYCCATTLGLPWTRGVDSGLLLCLFLGYAIAIALNMVSFLSSTSAPRIAVLPQLKSRIEQSVREASTQQRSPRSVSNDRPASEAATPLELQPLHARGLSGYAATTDSVPRYLP